MATIEGGAFDLAILRGVPPSLARCELSFLERSPIDLPKALEQHAAYAALLRELGLEVLELPADPELPDSCFVEDIAVVLDELAVLTRPGAASRRGEVPAVAEALRPLRPIARIDAPATLEGGDVLRLGRSLFVGLSRRTNAQGIEQLRRHVAPHGYTVIPVPVSGCLHLKSAVTALAPDRLLVNPRWLDPEPLAGIARIEVDPAEPGAANVLWLRGVVVAHPGFPRTLERIAAQGLPLRPLDVSEFLKAEAALTCKSLLLRRPS